MMKKVFLMNFIVLAFMMTSCSSDDDSNDDGNDSGITDEALSGELYGTEFSANGGRADLTNQFGEETISIFLTSEDIGCEVDALSWQFPITIVAPRSEGVHNSNVYVNFSDPDSDAFMSVSSGISFEIISLTENSVEAKINLASGTTANNLNGKFEMPICEE